MKAKLPPPPAQGRKAKPRAAAKRGGACLPNQLASRNKKSGAVVAADVDTQDLSFLPGEQPGAVTPALDRSVHAAETA